LLFFGIFLLKYGADFLVSSAIDISNYFNIEERIIAVTVVAIGTSIPELATSIVAALKKEVDLAVGNIIGSNIFNLLAVLGTTAIFKDVKVVNSNILSIDYSSMFLLTLIFGILIYFFTKGVLDRKKGVLLVMLYAFYIYFTIK
jgi:cation:H+ antiporter